MPECPHCGSVCPEGKRYCGDCGADVDRSSAPTETGAGRGAPRGEEQVRFIPGTVLGKRYRIVGLLGRGGMGEVYRADDLKLGQPVALKFLPATVEKDQTRLDRFLNEVKTALRVTHPNVCRVFDIGEIDTATRSAVTGPAVQHYLSMEYVDGEDLASLLRRIGRLPQDKAIQIARQLCAGLAAAHEQGILHRDLKPANVMIDGRGRAKITDFGLAGLAQGIEGDDVRVGTPLYMAPEQRAGREVTSRSDVYSLGLVLYELFTGRRAFEGNTPAEIARLQEQSTPTSPSSHVEGLDPTVERVILRCLEKDPALRPAGALAVAAALPGGDPLAAALAAGETPSPEMVANAGGEGTFRPGVAVACLIFFLLAQAAEFWSLRVHPPAYSLYSYVSLEKSPQVLARDAREILERIGYDAEPADVAYGFAVNRSYLQHIQDNDASPTRWDRLRSGQPPALGFWYRQSPRLLVPERGLTYTVSANDPPFNVSGMARVQLDTAGRLRRLRVVPPQLSEDAAAAPEPDWAVLFAAAGLDIATFTAVDPLWVPDDFCDARAAWEGSYPIDPETKVRVEAGAYRGRPSWFAMVDPWARPERMEERRPAGARTFLLAFLVACFLAVIVGALLLARRNLRLGRGDRRGATRLALCIAAMFLVLWAVTASHVPDLFDESDLFMNFVGSALLYGAVVWLIYVALEPFLRRRWPEALVSWNRLLAGRLRDPRIGRDVLAGAAAIGMITLAGVGMEAVGRWLGLPPDQPSTTSPPDFLLGASRVIGFLDVSLMLSVLYPVVFLFVLLLLRILLRKQWLAFAALVTLTLAVNLVAGAAAGATQPAVMLRNLVHLGIWWTVMIFVFTRFGLLGLCAGFFIAACTSSALPPIDLTAWHGTGSASCALVALALVLWAFYVSLGGRSPFGGVVVPED